MGLSRNVQFHSAGAARENIGRSTTAESTPLTHTQLLREQRERTARFVFSFLPFFLCLGGRLDVCAAYGAGHLFDAGIPFHNLTVNCESIL